MCEMDKQHETKEFWEIGFMPWACIDECIHVGAILI